MITRRTFVTLAAATAATSHAHAADYPTKTVRLLVGFPAGSAPDIVARFIAEWLSRRLGQSFVVEARAGAGSNLATETVLKSPPDGYTLLLCSGSNAYNAALYDNLNFNFVRDAAPIGGIYRGSSILVTHPSVPVKTVAELIALLKANPGKLNMASNGNGSVGHVYGSLFKMMTGTDMVHVAYRDNPIPDLLDGRTQVYFSPLGSAIEFVRVGKLRPLGMTGAGRWPGLPDVPPIGETIKGYDAEGWMGLAAPRGTPPEIIALIDRELAAAMQDPLIKQRITDLGGETFPANSAAFTKFISDYTDKWGKVIRDAGIKIDG